MKMIKFQQIPQLSLERKDFDLNLKQLNLNSHVKFSQKSLKNNLPNTLGKLELVLPLSQITGKSSCLDVFKRVKYVKELNIALKGDFCQVRQVLLSLQNLRVKSIQLTLEHFGLFAPSSLKRLLQIVGSSTTRRISLTINYSGTFEGNNIVSFFLNSKAQFNDAKLCVLSEGISAIPRLEHLELKFTSSHLFNLSKRSMIYLGRLIKRLEGLSSLNLLIPFKDIDYEALNQFSKTLSKKRELKFLQLNMTGFRRVSPDPLFTALSQLTSLKSLLIENDCGWNEPNIQDFAAACERLVDVESFRFSYTPMEKMAYNPLFRQALTKFTKLRSLSLNLSNINEPELFELSHSLQYLVNLERLDLNFVSIMLNAKNMKRFSNSLVILQNIQCLVLKFVSCKIENELMLLVLNSLRSLTKLQELTFHLLDLGTSDHNQVFTETISSLQAILDLRIFELKLDGEVPLALNEKQSLLFEFLRSHQELQTCRINLNYQDADSVVEKALRHFLSQEKLPKLTSLTVYNPLNAFS